MNAVLPPQQIAVSPSQPCLWDSTAWLYNFISRGCEGEFIYPEKEKKAKDFSTNQKKVERTKTTILTLFSV